MPVISLRMDISALKTGANQASSTLDVIAKKADSASDSANQLGSSIASAAKQVLALVGAYKALEGMKGFVQRGIEFNSTIEQSRIGMASLIATMAKLQDEQGRTLEGAEKYAAAQSVAAGMMKEIQRLGLETTATTQELVQGVQNVMGAAMNAGLKLEQIPKFAVTAAQAMQAMGIPLVQMRTEIEALLTGNINKAQGPRPAGARRKTATGTVAGRQRPCRLVRGRGWARPPPATGCARRLAARPASRASCRAWAKAPGPACMGPAPPRVQEGAPIPAAPRRRRPASLRSSSDRSPAERAEKAKGREPRPFVAG